MAIYIDVIKTDGKGNTTRETVDQFNRLVKRPEPENKLAPAATPPAIRAQTGIERTQTGKVESKQVTAQSTDGLFTFVVNVVK